jgi:hypothetical protein
VYTTVNRVSAGRTKPHSMRNRVRSDSHCELEPVLRRLLSATARITFAASSTSESLGNTSQSIYTVLVRDSSVRMTMRAAIRVANGSRVIISSFWRSRTPFAMDTSPRNSLPRFVMIFYRWF